ncbi:unnamed protein product [Callosobruchus maculatus]|uniref:Uncharacterized protein n=1 Tax=Callosobruchus maculatus TaxID=64391 RepID=A0A653BZE2_CALMS|nr:unnamed protein product [Callosobruchus maculatus]
MPEHNNKNRLCKIQKAHYKSQDLTTNSRYLLDHYHPKLVLYSDGSNTETEFLRYPYC